VSRPSLAQINSQPPVGKDGVAGDGVVEIGIEGNNDSLPNVVVNRVALYQYPPKSRFPLRCHPLPAMMLPGAVPGVEVVPPMMNPPVESRTSTPFPPLGSRLVPVASVPMKLPCTLSPWGRGVAFPFPMTTPSVALPEMTLPAPARIPADGVERAKAADALALHCPRRSRRWRPRRLKLPCTKLPPPPFAATHYDPTPSVAGNNVAGRQSCPTHVIAGTDRFTAAEPGLVVSFARAIFPVGSVPMKLPSMTMFVMVSSWGLSMASPAKLLITSPRTVLCTVLLLLPTPNDSPPLLALVPSSSMSSTALSGGCQRILAGPGLAVAVDRDRVGHDRRQNTERADRMYAAAEDAERNDIGRTGGVFSALSWALALRMACRNEPGPLSLVLTTVN